MTCGTWLAALIVLLPIEQAAAAQIDALKISHAGNDYRMNLTAWLDADPARAFAVLTRYRRLPDVNPAVVQVRILRRAPGMTQIYTDIKLCVTFLCRHLHQVQRMRQSHHGNDWMLEARVIPAQSDLRYGYAHWRFHPCGTGTCLTFTAEIQPKFWVAPLIGPWLIKRKMRQEALATSRGIERLAHATP